VTWSLRDIHAQIGGQLDGDPDMVIEGINALETAQPGQLTFADSDRLAAKIRTTRAAAAIVPMTFPAVPDRALIRVENPRVAFTKVMYLFQQRMPLQAGVDRHAVIAPDATLGEGMTIRACAVIHSRARIGRGTLIESGAHIGEGVTLGEECVIGPNVVIRYGCRIGHRVVIHAGTVIGADGFGYVWTEGRHVKIPQLGNVVIEDDVELGANVCVDRATLGSTIIKRGTKIDNLVQIAHNDVIGEHVTMSGQVGLAGSVTVGDRAVFGGQAGVADHLTIGNDARIGAGSGVIKDVPSGETVWWFPARPIKRIKEELASLAFLPDVIKELKRSKRTALRRTRKS